MGQSVCLAPPSTTPTAPPPHPPPFVVRASSGHRLFARRNAIDRLRRRARGCYGSRRAVGSCRHRAGLFVARRATTRTSTAAAQGISPHRVTHRPCVHMHGSCAFLITPNVTAADYETARIESRLFPEKRRKGSGSNLALTGTAAARTLVVAIRQLCRAPADSAVAARAAPPSGRFRAPGESTTVHINALISFSQ